MRNGNKQEEKEEMCSMVPKCAAPCQKCAAWCQKYAAWRQKMKHGGEM